MRKNFPRPKPNGTAPGRHDPKPAPRVRTPAYGLARVIAKRGHCSRSEAQALVRAGRVTVAGRRVLDPEAPTALDQSGICVDGAEILAVERVYLMLNKPRGLVTTVSDERGRDTVYRCFDGTSLPWLAPVGRLDKASEGLLLFTNDSAWAARLTDPASHVDKTYHVQIDRVPDAALLDRLRGGVDADGEHLAAKSLQLLRSGEKQSWLEVVLDEGRNRHIRRLLGAHAVGVQRLIRVAVGDLALGDVPKGAWRALTGAEVQRLGAGTGAAAGQRGG
jgi:23S rRNA pseudouridine2605 synthase